MHRHIVYPGQIPLDTDLLNAIQDTYYGVGWLSESILGTNTATVGLTVAPTVPASLQVNVAPGAIYSFQTVDSSAYGSLGTDPNQFVKQGLLKTTQTLTITPPATTGYSQNYLVQVAFAETDTAAIILPYYNASNPSVAWSGPNNSGTSQNTIRQDNCVISLKAGVPAATGSQTTPSPDAGNLGLYVITVANGQTTITSGNISLLSTAPFFTPLPQIPTAIQNNQFTYAAAGGSANLLTATLTPAPTALSTSIGVELLISATNTAAAQLNLNGLGAYPIVRPDGAAVVAGDLLAGSIVGLNWTGSAWMLTARPASMTGSQTYLFAATNSIVVPPGMATCIFEVWAAGGGGGGTASGTGIAASGGGGGQYRTGGVTVVPGETLSIIIGAGGNAGAAGAANNGTTGGNSQILRGGTSLVNAIGGFFGFGSSSGLTPSFGAGGNGGTGGFNIDGDQGLLPLDYGSSGPGLVGGLGGVAYATPSRGVFGNTGGGSGATNGASGRFFGGGGCGGRNGGSGGAGAQGFIKLTFGP